MKTAIFGGSFNPVHNGHLALVGDVLKLGYEKILFIPAAQSPFKSPGTGASDEDRIIMLKLALEDINQTEVWDGEIRRGGISYSIDTVKELMRLGLAEPRIGLIIGDDLASSFSSWKGVEELLSLIDLIIIRRIGFSDMTFPYPFLRLHNRLVPYSSTQIRKKILEKGDYCSLLPRSVATYIIRNTLYANAAT